MDLDLMLYGLVGGFAIVGILSGFGNQAWRLGVLVIAYLLAAFVSAPTGAWLVRTTGLSFLLATALGFGLLFVGVYGAVTGLIWLVLRWYRRKKGFDSPRMHLADRILGGILGGVKGFLLVFLLLCAVVWLENPQTTDQKSWYRQSRIVDLAKRHNLLQGMELPLLGKVGSLGRQGAGEIDRDKVKKALPNPKIQGLLTDPAAKNILENTRAGAILQCPPLSAARADPAGVSLPGEID